MSRSVYKVVRGGKDVATVVMHDSFADGFKSLVKVSDLDEMEPDSPKGMLSKIRSYLKAEASLAIEGPVSDEVYLARLQACRGCEHRLEKSGGEWCMKCGCGTRKRAELTIKASMPAATCPIGKWPQPEGDR
jgi:hypothetical protein